MTMGKITVTKTVNGEDFDVTTEEEGSPIGTVWRPHSSDVYLFMSSTPNSFEVEVLEEIAEFMRTANSKT